MSRRVKPPQRLLHELFGDGGLLSEESVLEPDGWMLRPAGVTVAITAILVGASALAGFSIWPWGALSIRLGRHSIACEHTIHGVSDGYSTVGLAIFVVAVVLSIFGKAAQAKAAATAAGALVLLSASLLSGVWLERALLGTLPDPPINTPAQCAAVTAETLQPLIAGEGYARALIIFFIVAVFLIVLEMSSPAAGTALVGRRWVRRRRVWRWLLWAFLVLFTLFWVLTVRELQDEVVKEGGRVVGAGFIPMALFVVVMAASIPRTRARAAGIAASTALLGILFALFSATYQLYYSHINAKLTRDTGDRFSWKSDISESDLQVLHDTYFAYGLAIFVCVLALAVAYLSKGLLRPLDRPASTDLSPEHAGNDESASTPTYVTSNAANRAADHAIDQERATLHRHSLSTGRSEQPGAPAKIRTDAAGQRASQGRRGRQSKGGNARRSDPS